MKAKFYKIPTHCYMAPNYNNLKANYSIKNTKPRCFSFSNSTIQILYNLSTSHFVFHKQVHSSFTAGNGNRGSSDHTAPHLWNDYQSNMHLKTEQKVKNNHRACFPQILSTNL